MLYENKAHSEITCNQFLLGSFLIMLRILYRFTASICAVITSYAIWQDINSPFSSSLTLGKMWYVAHPSSLQVTEAIVSRYIDPCGLIISLNCTPFLWHPLIATVLSWPAGLVGFVITGLLWFSGKPTQRDDRHLKKHSKTLDKN